MYNKFNMIQIHHNTTLLPLSSSWISLCWSNQPNHCFLGFGPIHLSNIPFYWCSPLYHQQHSLKTSPTPCQVIWWLPLTHNSHWYTVQHAVWLMGTGKAENVVQVTKALQDVKNTSISPQTICCHLKKAGMKAVVKKKCPHLTQHCYGRGGPYLFFSVYLSGLCTLLALFFQWLYRYCFPGLSQRSGHTDLGSSNLFPSSRQYCFPMLLFIAWSFPYSSIHSKLRYLPSSLFYCSLT